MNLTAAAIVILQQLNDFLVDIPLDIYVRVSERVPKSTIGKHVRHLLDHYRKLIHADLVSHVLQHQDEPYPQLICYDKRQRDVPEERETKIARAYLSELVELLERLPETGDFWNLPVDIEVVTTQQGASSDPLRSSLGREVWFVVHHAIHHHAMIKVIAEEFGINVTSDFGLAPSTAFHRK
jgi:uncharacterized damage-inducible protein DinB